MEPKVRPKTDQWTKYMKLQKIANDDALARRMGMSPASVSRVLRRNGDPGPRFIAAALIAFDGLAFEDLFEVTPADDTAKPPPEPLAGGSSDSAPRPQGPRPR